MFSHFAHNLYCMLQNENNFDIYLFCFLNKFTHLFAFNEKSNLTNEFVIKTLENLKNGKKNYSYFEMMKIINSK